MKPTPDLTGGPLPGRPGRSLGTLSLNACRLEAIASRFLKVFFLLDPQPRFRRQALCADRPGEEEAPDAAGRDAPGSGGGLPETWKSEKRIQGTDLVPCGWTPLFSDVIT